MAPLIFSALICEHTSCDFDDIIFCCKGKDETLCCVREQCLDTNHESLGCGCVTDENNKECCKIACVICSYGLKTPETCCNGATHCLCVKAAAALPFQKGYLEEPVCALYCCSCLPKCGCCTEAPPIEVLSRPMNDYSPIAPKEEMQRE